MSADSRRFAIVVRHRPAAIALVVVCNCLVAQGLGLIFFQPAIILSDASRDSDLLYLLYAASSICLDIAMFFCRDRRSFHLLLAARLAVFLLHCAIAVRQPLAELALLLAIVPEGCIYESYPRNLLIALSTTLAATAVCIAAQQTLLSWMLITAVTSCVIAVFGSLLVANRECSITQHAEIQRLGEAVFELVEANLGYQQYARDAEQASAVEERSRITREIHDIIGNTLMANVMSMEAAIGLIRKSPHEAEVLLNSAKENAKERFDEIRRILSLLRSKDEPRESFSQAVGKLVKLFRLATGIQVTLELTNTPVAMRPAVEETVYRLVQEGLTNSFRHGRTTRVLVFSGLTDENLVVVVEDDGGGIQEMREGIGIAGMRERVASVGGEFRFGNLGGGLQLVAEIPRSELSE
jgi:signal transduction histidine kinase